MNQLRWPVALIGAIYALGFLVCFGALAKPVHAWGSKGHRVVAEISAHYLTPAAIATIKDLLETQDLQVYVAASTWADEVRNQRRETGPWHYADRPLDSDSYVPTRDCPKNSCVISKISDFAKVIGDKELAKPIRAEALKFLIHFVGDIHQPLHAISDNDRGGNEVWVRVTGKTDRLHSVWDTYLVDKMGKTPAAITAALLPKITAERRAQWATGRPEAWAAESYQLAKNFIYQRSRGVNSKDTPILLPDSYVGEATPLIAERLAMAGIRLAWVLNSATR